MKITYDPAKRGRTFAERKLDFEDAVHVFSDRTFDVLDDRLDYGEERWITFGRLKGRLIALVWTPRGDTRRIISMRKANDDERQIYEAELDRSG
jgi:uncharacterized DUF497 family protein